MHHVRQGRVAGGDPRGPNSRTAVSDVVDVGQFGVRSRAHARVHVAMSLGRDFKRGLGGVQQV